MLGKKVSHGRGGMGNISTDAMEYVDGTVYSPPMLTARRNPRYSTGRGGAGNIRKFDPIEAEIAQDIPDGRHVPQSRSGAGRGGYGNYSEMRKRERQQQGSREGRRSEESTRSGYSTGSTVSTVSESGFAHWSRAIIFGKQATR